jgi:hypothetical protein
MLRRASLGEYACLTTETAGPGEIGAIILMSSEYMEQTQSRAEKLLSLTGLFDRHGILEAMLRPCRNSPEAQTNQRQAENNSDEELEHGTS